MIAIAKENYYTQKTTTKTNIGNSYYKQVHL